MSDLKKSFFSKLVIDKNLKRQRTVRKRDFFEESILLPLLSEYKKKGWIEHKRFIKKCKVRKTKPFDVKFEDKLWCIFADMGFNQLNSDRFFKLPYSGDGKLTQQIDIIAIDDETILIVECQSEEEITKGRSFKDPIEALAQQREGIFKTLQKFFPTYKHKLKFIFATENIVLKKPDLERLERYDIIHFDEEAVLYFEDLTNHLGCAAKYQLLGNLFESQKIPELDNKIPCIKGKLGPHTFYSFVIEPERLLKIGYVLHRTKANKKLMPTYQRVIKKQKLKNIENFIDQGGYFPNSIILSIDSKKPLPFDSADIKCQSSLCKLGVVSLPQKYKSAFIIDGQHRVYAYARYALKHKSTIPVVAFENLKRKEQVELFMQINSNQKAVSKNLRNTLNADLLWDSDNKIEAIKALKLRIAQDLGEDKKSPLCDKIVIGENKKTVIRCITIDTIYNSFNRGNFFGSVTKDSIKEIGSFYDGNVESTSERLTDFLIHFFDYIEEILPEEWEIGEDGFLTINVTIYCLILITSNIIDHLIETEHYNTRTETVSNILDDCKPYLDPILRYFKNLSIEERINLKKSYGSGGKTQVWRKLQQVIKTYRTEFNPVGLDEYIRDSSKRYNTKSFEIIRDIETHLKKDIQTKLEGEYSENWWKKGVPFLVWEKAELLAAKKNREKSKNEEVDGYDQLCLIDYRIIMLDNWRKLFEKIYSYPDVKGDKKKKTSWLVRLNKIRNENVHTYSVSLDEYDFLEEVHAWMNPIS